MRFLLAAILAGCALPGGNQPDVTQRATREAVLIIPNWQPSVGEFCGSGLFGCTRRYIAGNQWTALITVPEPEDFNDINGLAMLGHECWHALGARHGR